MGGGVHTQAKMKLVYEVPISDIATRSTLIAVASTRNSSTKIILRAPRVKSCRNSDDSLRVTVTSGKVGSFCSYFRRNEDLIFTLSTEDFDPHKKTDKPPKVLDILCNDTKYNDVSFVFPETSVDSLSGCIATKRLKLDRPSSAAGNKEEVLVERTLVAHRVILVQWPYFKAMFESDFAEGGAGLRQVTIKDTSLVVFKVLLRYMYTEAVPKDLMPKNVYGSQNIGDNVSWECIFLAADRYDIEGRREEARSQLLLKLNATEAKDFLFRTTYLFEDLRAYVIEYIVKECGHLFVPASSRDLFKDHPEYADILGELYEAHYYLYAQ
ncbi:hypothetical protein BGZ94_000233 [Podila epigama]|nr:hypothetical protein BGZ94_000233 [Podila epigama]